MNRTRSIPTRMYYKSRFVDEKNLASPRCLEPETTNVELWQAVLYRKAVRLWYVKYCAYYFNIPTLWYKTLEYDEPRYPIFTDNNIII